MKRSLEDRFAYQKTNRYFAQIANGLEKLEAEEISKLGASDVKTTYRGIYFTADHETLYRVNYTSRFASQVLAPILTFDCHSEKYLYKTAKSLPWKRLLSLDETFAVKANVSKSRIRHSQYAERRLKDAVVDYFREISGRRPNVDPKDPDLWLNLYIHNNKATISVDTSGGSLHRRGYRLDSVSAPMQETVAAAIIKFSGWSGQRRLYDPMCGSGTLLAEAYMYACRIPAGYLRCKFGFEQLPDFDEELWKKVKQDYEKQIKTLPKGLIAGSDLSEDAVRAAGNNLKRLPGGENVDITRRPFQKIDSLKETVIICNPPYGIRSNDTGGAKALLDEFVSFLKERCSGAVAYIYLGRKKLFKSVFLKASWEKEINSGGLRGYLAKYEIR
ncbi:MAG: THUMP domain-containing protein [Candidatus Krumholzibacteriota bacterium]|nr:THUMP domain-containing protein [Candidatus Krumholzibacteriota bacterium]